MFGSYYNQLQASKVDFLFLAWTPRGQASEPKKELEELLTGEHRPPVIVQKTSLKEPTDIFLSLTLIN